MKSYHLLMIVAMVVFLGGALQAGQATSLGDASQQNWLAMVDSDTAPADAAASVKPDADSAAPASRKGAPLPFHSIEGYSGGPITPMAPMKRASPSR